LTAGVEETKIGTVDDKSVYYSYRDNYMTYRSSSNPDIEQYKKADMNTLLTPKVQSFSRAEFEQAIYDRSSGIGYEGPLV